MPALYALYLLLAIVVIVAALDRRHARKARENLAVFGNYLAGTASAMASGTGEKVREGLVNWSSTVLGVGVVALLTGGAVVADLAQRFAPAINATIVSGAASAEPELPPPGPSPSIIVGSQGVDVASALEAALQANLSRVTVTKPVDIGAGGAGYPYDPYLPPEWTDVVHYEDFTGVYASARFDTGNGFPNSPSPYDYLGGWGNECTGGAGSSGYVGTGTGGLCRALDSINVGNQASAPWVWEWYNERPDAGRLTFGIDFASGNGDGAAANLTKVYVRFSIYFEEDGTGTGVNDYVYSPDSNKLWNFNNAGGDNNQAFLNLWYDQGPEWRSQSSPNTETCDVGLTANTWEDYYPGDTVPPQSLGNICNGMGRGGWGKIGVWQHHFICVDFSPSAGSRIMSYGVYSEDEQGIAAYHNNVTNHNRPTIGTTDTDFDSWGWNGTYGGDKTFAVDASYYLDEILIMTGGPDSGSCVAPPSF